MNLNGRDYVFSKAIGDAEWWIRKKQNQERELWNSSYVSRLFSILPYPVTGIFQENLFGVFENSDKPKGLWGYCKIDMSNEKLTGKEKPVS